MARKTGQINRRDLAHGWSASGSAAIRKRVDASTSASSFTVVCALLRPTSTACWWNGTFVATSALPGKPSASISITGSTSVPVLDCVPRASATTRTCSHGMFVQVWAQDPLGSFRRQKFDALQRAAEPKAVGTHDSLHARSPLFITSARWWRKPPRRWLPPTRRRIGI